MSDGRQRPALDRLLEAAVTHHQQGRFAEAERAYRRILQEKPGSAEANHGLGLLACHAGQPAAGLPYLKKACNTDKRKEAYLLIYAEALLACGMADEAMKALRAGASCLNGISAELSALSEQAALCHLDSLLSSGKYAELEKRAERLTKQSPDSGLAWMMLGAALASQGKTSLAILEKAVALLPGHAGARNNLGNALCDAGRINDAVTCYLDALKIDPGFADAHGNLGLAFKSLGKTQESINCFKRALELNPEFSEAYSNLGNAYRAQGEYGQAVRQYQKALEISPGFADAHNNLGSVLLDLGDLPGALLRYERALSLRADYFEAHSNLLFLRNYLPGGLNELLYAEAKRFGDRVVQKARCYRSWGVDLSEEKALRIGLVSGDFCSHPVGYFIEGVLRELKRGGERLELHAYVNQHTRDEVTQRIRANCTEWKDITGSTDEQLAGQIHRDRIDILIDLSGHTANNRLPVFAWKPAPVQVSWLGYFATTGIKEIDYLLADPWTVPPGEEHCFSETIWRLPETRLCFTAPDLEVGVSPLPAQTCGQLTLGCFNNLTKMNDDVVCLWSRVLHALPESRLFLKAKQLSEESLKQKTRTRFGAHGISEDRLILEGKSPRSDYLNAYGKVDFCLDPFPFTGGTTTAESLWMGVPVLTLQGNNLVGRQGVGLLMNAGLPDWIAKDEDDYVDKALAHAADLPKLAAHRAGLRAQVLASPVFDAPRFARHLEEALRGMWRQWTESKT